MASDGNAIIGSIGAALVLGLAAIISVNLIKGPIFEKNQFEFRQEGPVFIRFNKHNGEMCYTGLAPNGKFATEAWLCMSGDKTKEAEGMAFGSRAGSSDEDKDADKTDRKKDKDKKANK